MFDVKITGITDTIRKLESLKRSLPDKMKELVERLMNEGYEVAAYAYATAEYAGTKNLTLHTPKWEDNKIVLVAEGETVAFIEFGSGTLYEDYPVDIPGDSKDPYTIPGMADRGEYGKGKGANPPWRYVGNPGNIGYVIATKGDGRTVVQTVGNPPARGMYNAAVTVADQEKALEIAKEVFR